MRKILKITNNLMCSHTMHLTWIQQVASPGTTSLETPLTLLSTQSQMENLSKFIITMTDNYFHHF